MGIPMIVMEPVKGGMLSGLPKEAQAILEEADPERSPASWALRWVGSHPGVKLVLSGMSSEEQLEDNIRTFSPFVPLGTQEEEVIGQAAKAIRGRLQHSCTALPLLYALSGRSGHTWQFCHMERGRHV